MSLQIEHAAQSTLLFVQPHLLLRSKKKGFEKSKDPVSSSGRIVNDSGGSSGTRFAVEIPLLESSGAATAALACSFLTALQQQRQAASPVSSSSKAAALGNVTLVFADAAAASAAAAQVPTLYGLVGSTVRVWNLVEACRQSSLGGLLVMVAPAVADVALVEQLVDDVWQGPSAITLNAEWASLPVPAQYKGIRDSFQVVYSFLPVSIQGILGKKEGAVLLRLGTADAVHAREGGPAVPQQWKILREQGGKFLQVGQTKTRPSSEDLELIFLNASAASSPLTAAAKFMRNLMPKKDNTT
ncbi:MAG: hypothetical protein WDW36_009699 [Sanguina aurantia]